jgi:hypothetical protein
LVQVVDGGPVGSVWDGGWSLVQDIAAVAKVSDENGWSSGGVAASMSGGGKDEISDGRDVQVGLADMENLVSRLCSLNRDSLPVVVPKPVLIVVKE